MESYVRVSKHAEKRMKERMGLVKKSTHRIAEKAFNQGTTHKESKGSLHRYITDLYLRYRSANNIRIYGKYIFIFSSEKLVTVMHLPDKLKSKKR